MSSLSLLLSPLTCKPECPQEEYVYEYEHYGSSDAAPTDVDTVDTEVNSSRKVNKYRVTKQF